MKLSELILAVGDENITFQNLLSSTSRMDKTKGGTKITFLTDAIEPGALLDPKGEKTIGLVIWLPRDLVEAARAKHGAA